MPEITVQIADIYDDAYQEGSSWIQNYNYVSFGKTLGIPCRTALRFSIPIPRGSQIISSQLEFCAGASTSLPTSFTTNIRVYETGNMPPFDAPPDIPLSTESVSWEVPPWTKDEWYKSTDVSTLVQHIVNRSDWQANNYIGFNLDEGDAGLMQIRDAYAYEYSPTAAAKLHVKYTLTLTESSQFDTLISKDVPKTYTFDNFIQKQNIYISGLINILLRSALTKDYPIDNMIQMLDIEKDETSDVIIKALIFKGYDIDALVKTLGLTKAQLMDTLIRASLDRSLFLETVISRKYFKTQAVDVFVKKIGETDTNIDSILKLLGIQRDLITTLLLQTEATSDMEADTSLILRFENNLFNDILLKRLNNSLSLAYSILIGDEEFFKLKEVIYDVYSNIRNEYGIKNTMRGYLHCLSCFEEDV